MTQWHKQFDSFMTYILDKLLKHWISISYPKIGDNNRTQLIRLSWGLEDLK